MKGRRIEVSVKAFKHNLGENNFLTQAIVV